MSDKIKVAIVFGGRSAEHEVSLQSAKNIIHSIDKNKYEPVLIGVDRKGAWCLIDDSSPLFNADSPEEIQLIDAADEVSLVTKAGKVHIMSLSSEQTSLAIDVLFPVLHGPFGEDGSIQGLAKLANLPCVGSGILGSAIGMDKDISKRLLQAAGMLIADFVVLRQAPISKDSIREAEQKFGYPMFVKPANMGSSVGVSKVEDAVQLSAAVALAFQYDSKVLVEEAIQGREIECSVLGNSEPIVSVPGEIVPTNSFYSYDAKYVDEGGALLQVPAQIDPGLQQKVQDTALQAFRVLECLGMSRVDMFVTEDDKIFVNEINTIPGFTKISMYPKLWQESGIPYSELIDRLISLAFEDYDTRKNLKVTR